MPLFMVGTILYRFTCTNKVVRAQVGHHVKYCWPSAPRWNNEKPFDGRVICESAPEVTLHKPVGRVKAYEIFTLNSPNYHVDRINDTYMGTSQSRVFLTNECRVILKEYSRPSSNE